MLVRTIAALLALGIAWPAVAQGIPKAQSPEEVGFVATRLKRLSDRIEEGVKNNELPGAVVLIARNGKIVMFDAFGYRDKETRALMKTRNDLPHPLDVQACSPRSRRRSWSEGKLKPGRSGLQVHSRLRRQQGSS